ncbi:MAG: DUF4175 family protein [Bacteroidetes bacterium]|nr:DUF4175 family protein [Bacteroidota bacterium]
MLPLNENYRLLLEKLDAFIRKFYKNQLLRGIIYAASLFLLFYIITVTLQYLGEFDIPVRTTLFWIYTAINVFILIKFIIIPLLHLFKLGKIISHDQAAVIIGKHFREVEDRLLNILQLKNISSVSISPQTAQLIDAGISQKIELLKPVPFPAAIDLRQNRKYLKYAVTPLILLLAILFASPGIIYEGTDRLVRYNTRFEKRLPFRFLVLNRNMSIAANDDFELRLEIKGSEYPDEVFVVTGNENHYRMKKGGKNSFTHLFPIVSKNTTFRLFASGYYSDLYEITALPTPSILRFTVDLVYPKYTGKKNEFLENSGDLIVPFGTKATWDFQTLNTSGLTLLFSDSVIRVPSGSENSFSHSMRLMKSEMYRIAAINEYLAGRDTIEYAINVIPDMFPSIAVEEIPDSFSDKRIYFAGLVKDDYGLTRLTFNYRNLGNRQGGEESGPQQVVPLPLNNLTTYEQFFHLWDMSGQQLTPGQAIEYYFEVWDNDGVHGSKSTRSAVRLYRAPTKEELSDRHAEKNEAVKNMLSEGIKEAKAIQKELEELRKRMMEKKSLSWEEKKKMEELMEKQKELKERVEEIQKQSSFNFSREEEFMQMSEELMEKREQLQDLFEKIMTDEMKDLLQQLEKTMEQMDKNKLQEMMEKMDLSAKNIEKELDRDLELFKRLEVEQKLEEIAENLKQLSESEKKLSEETEDKKEDAATLKEEQDELNRQFEEIRKEIDEMEKKNSELENPNKFENTESDEQSIKQDMENSSDQLGENNNKKASGSQKNAAQKMQKLSEKMEAMLAEMNVPSEDMNALRQILENLVKLSFDQEALMQTLEKTSVSDPKYVQYMQEQRKLKDDSKMIEDSLLALSKRVIQIEPVINREISAINMNMDKSIQEMVARRVSEARSRQQYTMTSVNNLALLLSEALEQMQQQAASQMAGSGQCNKPGSSKPSMSTLKKLQEQLSKQLQDLKEGNKPGGKKGNKGMSEELARMAAKQEFIRNEMRKLMGGNPMDKNTGNMQNLMKMMEQNETDLVNRQITEQTLMRQKEILTRMLEVENAMRERETDNQRIAEEAKNFEKRNFFNEIQYKYRKSHELELLKTVPPSLNPWYKNKVTEYFNNL